MDTRSDTLVSAPPSGRRMRMVSREWLLRSVAEAVERTLIEFTPLAPAARHTLRDQVVRRFLRLSSNRARAVRGLTRDEVLRDFERTHTDLLASHERARGELRELEARLAEARGAGARTVLTPETRVELSRSLEQDLLELLGAADPQAAIQGLLAREEQRRERALEQVLLPERKRAELLERRMVKLRSELERMERALVELERRSAIDGGLASIYRDVQGLGAEESEREAKLGLLRQIFEANLELQQRRLGLPAT